MGSNTNFDLLMIEHLTDQEKLPFLIRHINTMSKKLNDLQTSQSIGSIASAVTVVNRITSGASGGASISPSFRINKATAYPLVVGDNLIPFADAFDDLDYVLIEGVYKINPDAPTYKYPLAYNLGAQTVAQFIVNVEEVCLLTYFALHP